MFSKQWAKNALLLQTKTPQWNSCSGYLQINANNKPKANQMAYWNYHVDTHMNIDMYQPISINVEHQLYKTTIM